MDDDLEPKDLEDEFVDDDDLISGNKKPKKSSDDVDEDSLDSLAEEEDAVLPEDSFDDVDLW